MTGGALDDERALGQRGQPLVTIPITAKGGGQRQQSHVDRVGVPIGPDQLAALDRSADLPIQGITGRGQLGRRY